MEQPEAWTEALLCGSVLKAIAAACTALPMGPWDRKAIVKTSAPKQTNNLQLSEAA